MSHGALLSFSNNPSLYGACDIDGTQGRHVAVARPPGSVPPQTDPDPASSPPPPLLPWVQAWSLAILCVDLNLTYLKISGVLGLGGGSAAY